MRVKITKEMRAAIQQAVEEAGSQSELARRSGVDQRNLSRYVSGLNTMTDHIWAALYPYCAKYLPEDYPAPLRERPILKTDFGADAEATPVTREDAKRFRSAVKLPLIYVGGMVSLNKMEEVLADGFQAVQIARALVRDTDFVNKLHSGEITRSNHTYRIRQ